ncbi:hypothetical protein [Acetobacter estunensis]|uniref:hypothetical protein n=1 Tax=Acetobacter estunensis TaxID=104097 RepID=UPI001C2CC9E3|nr:hypothetical protein [Acetobacter estunensis]MBV1838033.1 hypothetical protein [Acetobacter estunensis]
MSLLGVVGAIGAALGSQAFRLGNVVFLDTEVPSALSWGGYQATSTFFQPGGGKVVVLGGYFDEPLVWNGIFRGSTALARARTLDAMARSGSEWVFSGGGVARQVVITAFEAAYTENGTVIPYRIACEVIPQAASTLSSTRSVLTSLIGTQATNALGAISGTFTSLSSYVSAASSSLSSYAGEITPLANLFGSGGSVSSLSATLSGISTQANALSSLSSNATLTTLGSSMTDAGTSVSSLSAASETELASIAANANGNIVSDGSSLIAAICHSATSSSSSLAGSYLNQANGTIETITGNSIQSAQP